MHAHLLAAEVVSLRKRKEMLFLFSAAFGGAAGEVIGQLDASEHRILSGKLPEPGTAPSREQAPAEDEGMLSCAALASMGFRATDKRKDPNV